jgi:L-ascorbate metabolism protein UlaG (beta-lactamase superfamily)
MRKFKNLKISLGLSSLFILTWLGSFFFDSPPTEMSFTSNPELKYLNTPPNWKGTPQLSDGTFQNIDHPFESKFSDVLKWKLTKNPQAEEKKTDSKKLDLEFILDYSKSSEDQLIWLGHASYLIQLDGVTILTDPVWIDNWVLKRNSQLPLDPTQLEELDYILISHDHRDHCDENTLKLLGKMFPGVQILTGLNMKPLIQDWIPKAKIQEASWYQNFELSESLKITFVPSRHWSRRGLMDQNERLWGGFFIQTNSKSIYFMGDSGYGPHFKQIAETLGSPDYALMGVGAYKPEWFMQQAHTSPSEAAKAFLEMNSKYFIPMHFGTFDLSDEPLLDPLTWLMANPEATNDQMILPILGKNLFVN